MAFAPVAVLSRAHIGMIDTDNEDPSLTTQSYTLGSTEKPGKGGLPS